MGFDAEGNAQWSGGSLLVDSVLRFKGQAADAVVVTEVDFAELGPRERRRLFVALTRARLQVALVTSDRAGQVLRERLGA
jgi:superfamily I DNA and RNA helicase